MPCNEQSRKRTFLRCPTHLKILKFGPTKIAKTSATLEINKNLFTCSIIHWPSHRYEQFLH
jgi:hypothetical protein